MKFHIKNDGMPGKCKAREGNCPLGGEHFDSLVEAAQAIERINAEHAVPVAAKRLPFMERVEQALDNVHIDGYLQEEIMNELNRNSTDANLIDKDFAQTVDVLLKSFETIRAQQYTDTYTRADARNDLSRASNSLARYAIFAAHGGDSLPKPIQDSTWWLAWEQGHAGGYNDVANSFIDLVQLASAAYVAGTQQRPSGLKRR